MIRSLAIGSLILPLAACSTGPQTASAPPPADQAAQVVIYRPAAFDHFPRTPTIELNGQPACDLGNGEYFARAVPAGEVAVSTQLWDWPGTSGASFQAEAGKTYHVRMAPHTDKRVAAILGAPPGVLIAEAMAERKGPFLLDVVAATEAEPAMAGMRQAVCKP